MGDIIRQVCLMSILCSAAYNITPEGAIKNLMRICCSVILMLTVLSPLGDFDLNSYADILARYRDFEISLNNTAREAESRLHRLVIEEEYTSYIMDKAKDINLDIKNVSFELEWTKEGFWVPCEVKLYAEGDEKGKNILSSLLHSELGISKDKVIWIRPE